MAARETAHDSASAEGIELRDFANLAPTPAEQGPKRPSSDMNLRGSFCAIDVDHQACRDHFALERTFLAFIRTANAFAQAGVAIAWLFRINDSVAASQDTSSLHAGKAIGAATVCVAIVVALSGAGFFMSQQKHISRGFITAGSATNWIIFTLAMTLLIASMIPLLISDTWRELASDPT